MAYIKTLLCLSVFLHSAVTATLPPFQIQYYLVSAKEALAFLQSDNAAAINNLETAQNGQYTVKVLQSNLPPNDQKELAATLAEIYNKYSVPIQRASVFEQYLNAKFSSSKNQVVLGIQHAVIIKNYVALFSINGKSFDLVWGL